MHDLGPYFATFRKSRDIVSFAPSYFFIVFFLVFIRPIFLLPNLLSSLSTTRHHQEKGCRSLLSIGGVNLQFYTNFALFSTLGGINLDQDFFSGEQIKRRTKKRSSPNMEHFFPRIQVETKKKRGLHQKRNTFSPNSSGNLRSDAHQSQINGGLQM